jgi:Icc protein
MPPVQLLQVTDTHLFGDESLELYDTNTARSLQAALRAALSGAAPRPDAVLVTGDVAEDCTREAYAHFRDALAPLGVPVYCLAGNHDSPALMAELLSDGGFQYGGAADLGAWRLVLLDTHVDRDPAGRLQADELARLDRELAAAAGRPVLVALHHPPVTLGSAWIDGVGLRNPADLYAVLDRHPHVRVVLGGHVHQAVDQQRGALRLLATPSTCAQFKPGTPNCVMDDRPPGYRWLTLHADGALDTRVGWAEDWVRTAAPRDTRGPEHAATD